MARVRPFVPFAWFFALSLTVMSFSGQAGLGKARLAGTVKADDGGPLGGAKVVLRLLAQDRPVSRVSPATVSTGESAVFETKTNKKGVWNYVGLAAGTWEITASAEGYHSAFRTCKILQLQENPRIELVLEKIALSGSETLGPGLLEKADALAFKKDHDGAIALYRKYLEIDPEAIMVVSAIGDCLLDKGDWRAALAQFQAFVDRTAVDPRNTPLTARALARIGECHMKAGDKRAAARYWRESVTLSPLDAEVPFNLAELLFAEGNSDEAARFYRVAAELSPGWNEPPWKLGLVHIGQKKYDLARASFRKVFELDPYSQLAAQARDMIKELDKIAK
jgi:tetratricopeptide (TPR) repeat protein